MGTTGFNLLLIRRIPISCHSQGEIKNLKCRSRLGTGHFAGLGVTFATFWNTLGRITRKSATVNPTSGSMSSSKVGWTSQTFHGWRTRISKSHRVVPLSDTWLRSMVFTGRTPRKEQPWRCLKLKQLESFLGEKKFFGGETPKLPDFHLYEVITIHTTFYFPDDKEKFPKLMAFLQRFEELPKIKAYQASDKFIAKPFFGPAAKWDLK